MLILLLTRGGERIEKPRKLFFGRLRITDELSIQSDERSGGRS